VCKYCQGLSFEFLSANNLVGSASAVSSRVGQNSITKKKYYVKNVSSKLINKMILKISVSINPVFNFGLIYTFWKIINK